MLRHLAFRPHHYTQQRVVTASVTSHRHHKLHAKHEVVTPVWSASYTSLQEAHRKQATATRKRRQQLGLDIQSVRQQHAQTQSRSLPNYPACINELPEDFAAGLAAAQNQSHQPDNTHIPTQKQSPADESKANIAHSQTSNLEQELSIRAVEQALTQLATADLQSINIPPTISDAEKPHKELPNPEDVRAELPQSLSFNTVVKAFAIKSDYELLRSIVVFRLCGWLWLVKHARQLLNISYTVLGKTITNAIMKRSFFAHFCAGETGEEIGPVIQKLESSGVGAILDYAAEADVEHDSPTSAEHSDRREGVTGARTYDYSGEEECDANAKICLACIEDAGRRPDGFAAIKLTALGKPELLQHLSNVLMETKRMFETFLHSKQKGGLDKQIPKIDLNTKISFEHFRDGLKAINVNLSDKIVKRLFKRIDSNKSGDIDYLEWISFLDPRLLGGMNPAFKTRRKGDVRDTNALTTLTDEEMTQLNNMIVRLEILAERASQRGVRLMVDAEQTYFQPAIDHLVLGLQRKYNKEIPLIYNTYQCYLKDTHSRLVVDVERAHREGFLFAAKVVRGAYMVQERKRATELQIEDPICETIEDTHKMYHDCVDLILKHIDIADIMVATHNEKSVQFVERRMREIGIPAKGGGVYFGQLLGMCDHVSFTLGVMNFSVYKVSRAAGPACRQMKVPMTNVRLLNMLFSIAKYVPYGSVDEVIPYLLRRAEENSSLLGSATKEKQLIWRELLRRRVPFVLPYLKPIAA